MVSKERSGTTMEEARGTAERRSPAISIKDNRKLPEGIGDRSEADPLASSIVANEVANGDVSAISFFSADR
jgi:hypothetical protein